MPANQANTRGPARGALASLAGSQQRQLIRRCAACADPVSEYTEQMAGMKVSPGFEDPSARPDTTLAARVLMLLTGLVTVAAVVAIGVWLWPAIAALVSQLGSAVVALLPGA